LTCAHCVEDAIKIVFTIPGQTEEKHNAELVSACFDRDIALIKSVKYRYPTFLELGDSNSVSTNNDVISIGYPLGHSNIKTAEGTVSGRQNGMIQHHVPINPGNSGGPLLNTDRKVVGINSAKMVSNDVEGVGYTIPSNDITVMMKELMNPTFPDKVIYEPSLLVETQTTDDNIKRFFGCNNKYGVIVNKILDISPLYEIGMRESDFLLSINGCNIDSSGKITVKWAVDKLSLNDYLMTLGVDDEVEIEYYSSRDKNIVSRTIKFDPKKRLAIRKMYTPYQKLDYIALGGLIFMNLNMDHVNGLDKNVDIVDHLRIISYGFLENINKRRVLLSAVMEGSDMVTTHELTPGVFLENINGHNVNTLDDIKEYFNEGFTLKGTKFIYIKLSSGKQLVLNTSDMLKEDIELSKVYRYDISDLLQTS
jgi:serine protease Do